METMDLFATSGIEIKEPQEVKAPEKTVKPPHKDPHVVNAMKTISWKFKDLYSEYPELRGKNQKITGPKDLFERFKFLFDHETKEHFVVFWLNSSNVVTGYEIVSTGNLNSSIVHPREVFKGAIVASAANIILAHNHPSGNTEPSNEDISITKRLVEAGKLMDIKVFDHLIFTDNGYRSFVEDRLI